MARDCPQGRESRPPTRYSNRVQVAPSEGQTEGQLQADNACNRVMCDTDSVVLTKRCDETDCWEFGNFPEVNHCKEVTQCWVKPPPELKVSTLQYVNVTVNGNKAVVLCDSGSQIPVVSSRLLDVGDDDKMGTVNLQGVVGEAVTAPLMSVNVKLSSDGQCEQVMEELQLLCAVDLSSSSHDVILPVDVVDELRDMPVVNVMRMPVTVPRDVIFQVAAEDVADTAVSDSTVVSNDSDEVCDADCLGMSDSVRGADELIAEQHSDARLADCRQLAKVNEGDFVISRSALYHKDKVEGPICQLCVPQSQVCANIGVGTQLCI